MTTAIVNDQHKQMGIHAGLNAEQLATFYTLIENAAPCSRRDVTAEVYSQQVARAAVRAARDARMLDATDRMVLGLAETFTPRRKSTAAERNPCSRCGGVGCGNWGSVRNGRCFKCGGDGVNR